MTENSETLKDLVAIVEDSLQQAKSAYKRVEELESEKVRLEKVASSKTFSAEEIDRTIGCLERFNFINSDHREKYASMLRDEPEKSLSLLRQVIQISAPSHQEGTGISKSASARSDEASDDVEASSWSRVLSEGA